MEVKCCCSVEGAMETRFWSKVHRGTDDECWEWTAARMSGGYGEFGMHGSVLGAHRVAWGLIHGKIPIGLVVRHTCRLRHCVNPAHMELGPHTENMRDKVRDGTNVGSLSNRKLTDEQIVEIKQRLAAYEWGLATRLATQYGVSPKTISAIRRGRTWKQ